MVLKYDLTRILEITHTIAIREIINKITECSQKIIFWQNFPKNSFEKDRDFLPQVRLSRIFKW
jgi:hypothetical protein